MLVESHTRAFVSTLEKCYSGYSQAWSGRRMLPLGGTRELGSHKGYGLAVAVDILTAVLAGGMHGDLFERNPPGDEKLR